MRLKHISLVGAIVAAVLVLSSFAAPAETLVALMTDKKLRFFSSTAPSVWLKTVDITGIQDGLTVQALDFRPDGSLVVIVRDVNSLRPYTVNPTTGAATIGPPGFNPATANSVAFDAFSHDVHNEDLVLTTDDHLLRRFYFSATTNSLAPSKLLFYDNNPSDGDPADIHAGATPVIVALASTNSFPGAESAVLYGIDSTQNSLIKIDYDTGSMDTIATVQGPDGSAVTIGPRTGFDISGQTGNAYLATGLGAPTTLYKLDLTTGVATTVGNIGPAQQEIGIVVQDISALPPTKVVNLSTRSKVGAGDEVMIAGFIAQGGASSRLLIRAAGPSLGAFGVNNALLDPVLSIFDGNGALLATNDNWKSDQQSEITQTGLAPSNDLEAAYLGTFPPGQYTARISAKNGAAGVGLLEIYKLPDL